jgi:hypothetical protein
MAVFETTGTLGLFHAVTAPVEKKGEFGRVDVTVRWSGNNPDSIDLNASSSVINTGAEVINSGDTPAWVRVILAGGGLDKFDIDWRKDEWGQFNGAGIYYYTRKLEPGESAALFTSLSLKLDGAGKTDYAGDGSDLSIAVNAEAVQTGMDGETDDPRDAFGIINTSSP